MISTYDALLRKYSLESRRRWVYRPNLRSQGTYVHIPKTGGNTVRKIIKPKTSKHATRPQDQELGPYYATVRNPFDWLVSMWFYDWPGDPSLPGVRSVFSSLEDFLYRFNSPSMTGNGFWDGPEDSWCIGWQLRHLQVAQVFEPFRETGDFFSFADFYIRSEQLNWIITQEGKTPCRENTSEHKDYRTYYTRRLIDHVTEWRCQELELLGYDFDGPTDSLATFEIIKPFSFDVARAPALSKSN